MVIFKATQLQHTLMYYGDKYTKNSCAVEVWHLPQRLSDR